jgi:hypothetical protein
MSIEHPQNGHEFAAMLVVIKDRAGRLGLWRTMHALDAATEAVALDLGAPDWRPESRRRKP